MPVAMPKGVSQNLKVKFNEVPSSGLKLEFSPSVTELNKALEDLLGSSPDYHASLHLSPVEDMVNLKGEVKTKLRISCSRCGEDYVNAVTKKFVIAFYKSENDIKTFSQAVDDIEGSFDLEFLEGNEINIGEVLHEQLALEIPFQPVCSESCKGLCTSCGTNLNEETCACVSKSVLVEKSMPFIGLKNLIGD